MTHLAAIFQDGRNVLCKRDLRLFARGRFGGDRNDDRYRGQSDRIEKTGTHLKPPHRQIFGRF
jgi:hypothetical protein